MSNCHWYLVGYDIRDAKRWRDANKMIKGSAERVQYSLFRCYLTPTQIEALRWELERILADEDDLLIVRLCSLCAGRVVVRGKERSWDEPTPRFRIL